MRREQLLRMLDDEPEDGSVYALPNQPCTCGRVGYCPTHGTYEPPQLDDGEFVTYLPVRCRTRQGRLRAAVMINEEV